KPTTPGVLLRPAGSPSGRSLMIVAHTRRRGEESAAGGENKIGIKASGPVLVAGSLVGCRRAGGRGQREENEMGGGSGSKRAGLGAGGRGSCSRAGLFGARSLAGMA